MVVELSWFQVEDVENPHSGPTTASTTNSTFNYVRDIVDAARYVASQKQAWMRGIEMGTHSAAYFDIEWNTLKAASFSTFASEVPGLVSRQKAPSCWVNDIRLRVTIPYPFPYVPWHWDSFGQTGTSFKLILYLTDVPPGSGEFCYVPQSHLIPECELTLGTGRDIAQKMGYRRYPGEAGTTLLFDTRGVHGAMKNGTRRPRLALIVSLEVD